MRIGIGGLRFVAVLARYGTEHAEHAEEAEAKAEWSMVVFHGRSYFV